MRKLIAGYYRLLDWLLAATVGILVVPVTLQIIARFTQWIPHWIWTEEMARFLFIWMVMLAPWSASAMLRTSKSTSGPS